MRRLTTLLAMAFAATVLLAACGGTKADALTGKNWQLVAITDKVPAFQGVVPPEDQAKFTITFNEALTFNSTVDCNKLAGTYKTTGRDGLEITPGPMTMAFCGEGSFDVLFVRALGKASTYKIVDDKLTITLTDEGTLTFVVGVAEPSTSAEATAAASATAAPTAAPTPAPTPTPTPKPTPTPTPKPTAAPTPTPTTAPGATPAPTAAPTPKPTAAPTAPPAATPPPSPVTGLLGKVWQLTSITETAPPFQGVVPEAQQPNYTVEFLAGGTFSAKADCNTVSGAYVTADPTTATGNLTITPGPSTVVACGPDSLGDLYVLGLSNAASYAIASNVLTITLRDGGTLVYK